MSLRSPGAGEWGSGTRSVRLGMASGAFALVMLLSSAQASASAADAETMIFPAAGAAKTAAPTASMAGGLNLVTLVVATVLAGIGGWAIWRGRRPGVGRIDRRVLAVEETRPLGNRQYLIVASYEGRRFLLGVCPGRIDMLAPLSADALTRRGE